jgi:selenocysteine lyase/cysteine desulfurase
MKTKDRTEAFAELEQGVDAVQLVAHRKVDMADCNIDYLVFSAHKVYAPFGSGALVARKGLLNFNTSEIELIRSSGEENTAGIAALGKALVLLLRIGIDLIMEEEQTLTVRVLRGLAQIPGVKTYELSCLCSLNYSCLALPG